jgi:predicted metalloprotease
MPAAPLARPYAGGPQYPGRPSHPGVGQQGFQQGWAGSAIPQPAWAPGPPVRSSSAPWLFALAVTVVLLVVALAAAVLYVGGSTTTGGATTARSTAARTTTTAVSTTSSTITGSAGATPTGTAALEGNPLYGTGSSGLPTQSCNAVGWPSDSTAAKSFFDSVTPCLDRAWGVAVRAAGLEYRPPTVFVPSGTKLSSPCGSVDLTTENVAAFYCGSNEGLYMPPKGLQVDEYGNKPVIYLSVFAHEYGHHVQMVTGILSAQLLLQRQYGRTTDRALEVARRKELQAQCMSGLFIKSVSDTGGQFTSADYRTAYEDQTRGDRPGSVRDHGTYAHAQSWWDTGYKSNLLARCNTWAASSADVA